jgi:hypothetical protein
MLEPATLAEAMKIVIEAEIDRPEVQVRKPRRVLRCDMVLFLTENFSRLNRPAFTGSPTN